jgi:hypothetical protein
MKYHGASLLRHDSEWGFMESVSFIDIEEDEKDLAISFALDDRCGGIRSLILHRTLFFEFILPDEERGTKVSLEGDELDEEHLNTLKYFEFDVPVLRMESRFRSYEIDARNLEEDEIEQIKTSLARQNYDGRFKVKFR